MQGSNQAFLKNTRPVRNNSEWGSLDDYQNQHSKKSRNSIQIARKNKQQRQQQGFI